MNPPPNKNINYINFHNNLVVADINNLQKYTYKSKRCTNPMEPDYKIQINKTNIENNVASHNHDYKIPVFTFDQNPVKNY
jgi:hypothetical protein